MAARSKATREDDRRMIVAALGDHPAGLTIDELLRYAWDVVEGVSLGGQPNYWNALSRMRTDLRALERAHVLVSEYLPRQGYALHFRLATAEDLDAEDDQAEVDRLLGQWEAADGGRSTARWDYAP